MFLLEADKSIAEFPTKIEIVIQDRKVHAASNLSIKYGKIKGH